MNTSYIRASANWCNAVSDLYQSSVYWFKSRRAVIPGCNVFQLKPNSTPSHMNGALLDRHGRFLDRFRQRGMRMTRPRQIF